MEELNINLNQISQSKFGIAIVLGIAAGGGEMIFVLNSILIDMFAIDLELHKTCFNFNAFCQSFLLNNYV